MNLSTNPHFTHGIEKLCTICYVILRDTDTTQSIFSTLEELESPMNVLQVLQSFSNFNFYNGAQRLCTTCYGKTIEVYKFIQMCNRAHDNMQDYLKHLEASETIKDVERDIKIEEISISPTRIIIDGREFLEETENEKTSKIAEMEIKIEERILQGMEKEGTSSNEETEEETSIFHTEIVTEGRKIIDSSNFDNLRVEKNNAQIHEHDERMGLIKSNDCHLVFSDKKELDDYRKEAKRTKEKPFLSEMCNSFFRTKYNLRNDAKRAHISEDLRLNQDRHQPLRDYEETPNRVHTGEKSFTSDFTAKSSLLGHIYNVVEAHKYEQCDRRFTQAAHLRRHMNSHNGVKAHKCKQCDRRFTDPSALRRHMNIHSGVKAHKCEHCDRRFTQAGNLRTHMLVHNGVKAHKCEQCNRRFTQAAHLRRHMNSHNGVKAHKCEQCDRRFTDPSALRRHMNIHSGVKAHKCEHCDRRFTQAGHLRTHMLVHNGVKAHKCEQCDRRFTQAGHLRTHMLVHNGVKAHKCEHCERRFTEAGHLRTHMLVHNGVKAYKCEQCDRRFSRAWALRRHMMTHN